MKLGSSGEIEIEIELPVHLCKLLPCNIIIKQRQRQQKQQEEQ